jgi:hypothetical protein
MNFKHGFIAAAFAIVPALPATTTIAADWTTTVSPATEEVLPPGSSTPQTLRFGEAVAIHGNMALVGMPSYGNSRGLVAVFTRAANGVWSRSATLTAPGLIEGDVFGQGVALRGRFAVVSSTRAIHVYYLNGRWHRIQTLTAPPNAWFNSAIDFEIPHLVVGGGLDNGPGAIYLFEFDPNRHRFQRRGRFLAPSGSAADNFGASVSTWNDVVAVGAPGYNGAQGAAYVFRRVAGAWHRQQLLNGMGEALDEYGTSIDVRGSTLVVGAPGENPVGPGPEGQLAGGVVHVFRFNGRQWVSSQRLRPTALDAPWYLNFGFQTQLFANRLAVSAPFALSRFDQGLVFVYSRTTGPYSLTSTLAGENSVGSGLGLSASALIAGVPFDLVYSIGYALIHDFPAL